MNLSEDKKKPLRERPLNLKKEMLVMHYKGNVTQNRSRFVTPSDYVNYLQGFNEISHEKLYKCIESLRIALTNNPVSWVKEFGQNQGLQCILAILSNCYEPSQRPRHKLQYECIKCLKALMNNTVRNN